MTTDTITERDREAAQKWAISNWKGAFELQDGPREAEMAEWEKAFLAGITHARRPIKIVDNDRATFPPKSQNILGYNGECWIITKREDGLFPWMINSKCTHWLPLPALPTLEKESHDKP